MASFSCRCFRPAAATRAVGVAEAPEGPRRSCEAGPAIQRVGKVISDGDREGGAMHVLLPAHHRPVGYREWWLSCTPIRSAEVAADSAAWPTQNGWVGGQYVHRQQCARLAALAPG